MLDLTAVRTNPSTVAAGLSHPLHGSLYLCVLTGSSTANASFTARVVSSSVTLTRATQ
jgi:hypothetical protein